MAGIPMDRAARFRYNLEFEYAMRDLLSSKHYAGIAGGFSDPDFCKKCMLSAVNRTRKRLSDILTMDERLRETSGTTLDRLERNVNETSEDVNNDGIIIANLVHLIAHLLGYDWLDVKVTLEYYIEQS